MSKFESALPAVVTFAVVTGVASVVLDIAQDLTLVASGVVPLASVGPALGALAVWAFHRRTVAELWPAPVARRQGVAHLVLGVVASVVFAALLVGVTALQGRTPIGAADVAGAPLPLVLLGLLLSAVLQELGWRGVLQPLLEHGFTRLVASMAVGLVWGFWLTQLFPVESSFGAIAGVIVGSILLSILLGYFGNGSRGQRVLAAAVVHWLVAVGLYLVIGGGQLHAASAVAFLIAIAITTAVFMAMFVAARARRARRRAEVDA